MENKDHIFIQLNVPHDLLNDLAFDIFFAKHCIIFFTMLQCKTLSER